MGFRILTGHTLEEGILAYRNLTMSGRLRRDNESCGTLVLERNLSKK